MDEEEQAAAAAGPVAVALSLNRAGEAQGVDGAKPIGSTVPQYNCVLCPSTGWQFNRPLSRWGPF